MVCHVSPSGRASRVNLCRSVALCRRQGDVFSGSCPWFGLTLCLRQCAFPLRDNDLRHWASVLCGAIRCYSLPFVLSLWESCLRTVWGQRFPAVPSAQRRRGAGFGVRIRSRKRDAPTPSRCPSRPCGELRSLLMPAHRIVWGRRVPGRHRQSPTKPNLSLRDTQGNLTQHQGALYSSGCRFGGNVEQPDQ